MRQDEQLRQFIIDELEMEPTIEANAIGIAVKGGVVTLTGDVDSYTKKLTIERMVQRVPGVKAVAEELQVHIPTISKRTDAELGRAAVTALEWDVTVPQKLIKLKVENGWITLSGTVKHGYEKQAATDAVKNLMGVRGVTNLLTIEPKADTSLIKQEIARTLHRSLERELDSISIDAKDGVATLHGTVHSWAEREDAARAARNVPGVATVRNFIAVS